jgi:hypothetical protein
VKPLQVLGGVLTNLCLRARYGGVMRTLQGLSMLVGEILAPQEFAGRRRGLIKALGRFITLWPYFVVTRVRPTARFRPMFSGWGYEVRRDGAFVSFRSKRETPRRDPPLVSILIRTVGRGAWLRQALESVAQQTWPNIEAIVIEDGPPTSRAIVDEFRRRLVVRYQATGRRSGAHAPANLALAEAARRMAQLSRRRRRVLRRSRRSADGRGRGNAYPGRVRARVGDRSPRSTTGDRAEYAEIAHFTRHRQRSIASRSGTIISCRSRAVIFHRDLYARHGGFAEDMDQLEDWNLWTRYTLEDDFVLVEKRRRNTACPRVRAMLPGRQERLDRRIRTPSIGNASCASRCRRARSRRWPKTTRAVSRWCW